MSYIRFYFISAISSCSSVDSLEQRIDLNDLYNKCQSTGIKPKSELKYISMDKSCLEHCLTDQERLTFERDGFLQVSNVLPVDLVRALETATDCIELPSEPKESYVLLDFIGKDDVFLELLDWPLTFPKVLGILGWHIQLYHSHIVVTPPLSDENHHTTRRLGWHQDTGRLNIELEGNPRPRVSLKVAYFLTDTSEPDHGNFTVVPGSHLRNELDLPEDGSDPPDAQEIRAKPGDAVFFDRRIWHAAGRNRSSIARKVLFYGYSYRWLKPRDNMTVAHYMDRSDPIRRQLLGAGPTGGMGFTSPKEEDVPLREWMRENLGEEFVTD